MGDIVTGSQEEAEKGTGLFNGIIFAVMLPKGMSEDFFFFYVLLFNCSKEFTSKVCQMIRWMSLFQANSD